MKKRRILTVLLAGILLLAGCAGGQPTSPPAAQPEDVEPTPEAVPEEPEVPVTPREPIELIQNQPIEPGDHIAVMETTMGTIRIRLFPQYTPIAVENFMGLIEEGFYDGRNFHRVISNFMIQGGAYEPTGMGGMTIFRDEEGNHQQFDNEVVDELWHFRGALSMANAGPNTNSSQFFIVQNSDPLDEGTADALRQHGFPEEVIAHYAEVGGTPHLDGLNGVHTVFGHVIEGMDVVDAIAGVATDQMDRPFEDVLITSMTLEVAE
ncbi:MAG: peptidylprolyl isomerase [Oscillospiraceae bacterium]|nr:peptidylprolyl isomerase [Oscillospiraceae bacterium]